MDSLVFSLVLAAAAMHATWNAVVKGSRDPLVAVAIVTMGSGIGALAVLPFIGWDIAPAAWLMIAASALVHIFYRLALVRGYEIGDMSLVYPVARGSAPLLTAIIGLSLFGEPVGTSGLAGILLIVAGVIGISLARRGLSAIVDPAAVGFALLTAVLITAYTFIDGFGARISGDASAYAAVLFAVDTPVFLLIVARMRGAPRMLAAFRADWLPALAGGVLSFLSYWIAIWAMAQAPIPLVAALRETSIAFGALIAVAFLGERLTATRLAATAVILAGAAMLRFA